MPIFFIPARGRKHIISERTHTFDLIFFIPARGRKHIAVGYRENAGLIFFIPARGWKCALTRLLLYDVPIFFIPVRGRKFNAFILLRCLYDFLYPRERTEMLDCAAAIVVSRFSLSPRGDGNNAGSFV